MPYCSLNLDSILIMAAFYLYNCIHPSEFCAYKIYDIDRHIRCKTSNYHCGFDLICCIGMMMTDKILISMEQG
jgi:hypothetical protein